MLCTYLFYVFNDLFQLVLRFQGLTITYKFISDVLAYLYLRKTFIKHRHYIALVESILRFELLILCIEA